MKLQGRLAAVVVAAAPLVCVGLAAMVLLRFPPGEYGFYPVCPVYRYLHVLCPGCGATRALAALLRGRADEALRLNWLIVMMLPVLAGCAVVWYRRWLRGFAWLRVPSAAVYGALGIAVIFGVARNL
ncbi:MAG TPA: DUF2752 domain-containing protein [Edaphobacter sp.]